jgi:predicted ArsR family transcriptional regulator
VTGEDDDAAFAAIDVLRDPVRRKLYRIVASSPQEVGRDGAAEAAGVSRSLAAFHLDKLVEAGLLETSFRRTSGRTGPGAGRPAKLYRRAPGERAVSVPPRSYGAASRLLAQVVDRAGLDRQLSEAARAAGLQEGAAADEGAGSHSGDGGGGEDGDSNEGREAGDGYGNGNGNGDPVPLLRDRGYQPFHDGDTVRLHNCPFHALAEEFPALICGMNLALIEGLISARSGDRWAAAMDPQPGTCCVALHSKNNVD